jgi:FixJ family two-component response regulator
MPQAVQRIYLVDDDERVLSALARLLRTQGFLVETYSSPAAFLDAYDHKTAGCLVLDLTMPELDGLTVQRLLKERNSNLPVIFLTGTGHVADSVHALKLGAADFLTKPVEADALIAAVRDALARNRGARLEAEEGRRLRERWNTLTPREREVLGHAITGRLNKQIAADLGTVEKTVKVHRGRMMEKLGLRNHAELIRFAQIVGIEPASEVVAEGRR